MSGHQDNTQQQPDQEIDNEQYYQILGIDKSATQQQIKQAYEKLITSLNAEQDEEDQYKIHYINEAYEILGDPQKRARYDKEGKVEEEDEDGQSPQDLFNMFFNGGKKDKGGQKQKPKMQSTQKPLQLTLQTIYKGDTIKIPHSRTRICLSCQGKGGQNVTTCPECKGQGGFVQMYQVGPGMYQQVEKPCDKCSGQGQIMAQGDRCKECQGKKIMEKETVLEVLVSPGVPAGYPIKIVGEGHEIPDAIPGDLIFVTKEIEHEVFKRQGADLIMKKNITLLQALTGFQFTLKHLDGTEYTIKTDQGQIIGDSTKKIVKGLGMPFFKAPTKYGNLLIEFHIIMPKRQQLSKEQINQLVSLMPGEKNQRPKDFQYKMFEDFDVEGLNTNEEGGKKPEDQYDEEAGQHGIPCQNQ